MNMVWIKRVNKLKILVNKNCITYCNLFLKKIEVKVIKIVKFIIDYNKNLVYYNMLLINLANINKPFYQLIINIYKQFNNQIIS
jgi:hypothetical protein